jgi:hypothetical protein
MNIVNNRRNLGQPKGAFENHHIIPKALGGIKSDICSFTYREHFILHWLLTKMTSGEDKRKMCFALHCLRRKSHLHKRKLNGWQISLCRKANSNAMKGNKLGTSLKNKKKSDIHKERMSISSENRKRNPCPNCGKMLQPANLKSHLRACRGILITKEESNRRSKAVKASKDLAKLKPEYKKPGTEHMNIQGMCQYCNKKCSLGNLSRWHGNNCRKK